MGQEGRRDRGDVQPRHCAAKQSYSLLLLHIKPKHFCKRDWWLLVSVHLAPRLGLGDRVEDVALLSVAILSRIDSSFLDIIQHIEGISWCFCFCQHRVVDKVDTTYLES